VSAAAIVRGDTVDQAVHAECSTSLPSGNPGIARSYHLRNLPAVPPTGARMNRLSTILLVCCAALVANAGEDPFGGLRLGVQSYTVRSIKSLDQAALAVAQDLKLKYIELYPGHLDPKLPADQVDAAKEKLAALGISVDALGVLGFGKDTAANRKLFEFGKRLGVRSLSADPDPAGFAGLDELCAEFQIPIAIHNHGPTHRYGSTAQLAKAFEGRHKLFGLCLDTGHTIRSGEDPLKMAQQFKDRLYGMHLKDFKKDEKGKYVDCMLGEGSLDVDGIIRFLIEIRFQGALSIEYEGGDPVATVQKGIARVQAAVAKAKAP